MSARDPQPLFTLVKADDIVSTEGLDYSASADLNYRYDEIRLVDDNNRPCAVPVSQSLISTDNRYEYTDGSIGDQTRLLRHEIVLAVDYITSDKRRQLERWMLDRAKVYFTPGLGRHTRFAMRPMFDTNSTLYDLTGRWTLSRYGDETDGSYTWDGVMGDDVMREFTTCDGARILKTPFGAGQVIEPAFENEVDVDFPTSTTEVESGWTSGGAGSGTFSRTYSAYGFGKTDCAGALRVQGTSSSASRYITRAIEGTGGASESLWACVFLRGHFGAGGYITLTHGTESDTVSLSGGLPDWTPIWLHIEDDFTFGSAYLSIYPIGDAAADTCDFWVGPIVATVYDTSSDVAPAYPHWMPDGTRSEADGYFTATPHTYLWPECGSLCYSFYVPSHYEAETDRPFKSIVLANLTYTPGLLFMWRNAASSTITVHWYYDSTNKHEITGLSPNIGEANSLIITWDGDNKKIYWNGALVLDEDDADKQDQEFTQQPVGWYIFRDHSRFGAWPLMPLAIRMDEEMYDADEVADIHAAMTYQAALEPIVAARGRSYRIRAIPSTPQSVSGDVHWIGEIVLEQVDYDADRADITSKEP